ncbi:MAG: hypothetical protein HRU78_10460 [Gammaproteobacteria bacterium]|nr:MAG: hypothetical protein HRU78_10460 [Gammaproteobacteria bacterium]
MMAYASLFLSPELPERFLDNPQKESSRSRLGTVPSIIKSAPPQKVDLATAHDEPGDCSINDAALAAINVTVVIQYGIYHLTEYFNRFFLQSLFY